VAVVPSVGTVAGDPVILTVQVESVPGSVTVCSCLGSGQSRSGTRLELSKVLVAPISVPSG